MLQVTVLDVPKRDKINAIFDAHEWASRIYGLLMNGGDDRTDIDHDRRERVWLRAELAFLEAAGFDAELIDGFLEPNEVDRRRRVAGQTAFKMRDLRHRFVEAIVRKFCDEAE